MSSPFVPSGFFTFRSPLLSLEELMGWGAELRAPRVESGALGDALTADQALLRERLRQVVQRPEVREALFVASPVLDESMPAWLQAPDSEAGKKVERTLVRYFSRMTARSTPFGLFAGQSVGLLGAHTSLQLEARHTYRRHTRLDTDVVHVQAGVAPVGVPRLELQRGVRPEQAHRLACEEAEGSRACSHP